MDFNHSLVINIFLICLSCFSGIICKKFPLPDIDSLAAPSETVGECQRCKLLTDSFNYWLKKTARGKYEGGDAAWEETKLKSYARSEMRLVEVQEGLCSEVKKYQSHCYKLAEEAEQPLERWWFQGDSSSIDIYTWLCIETLKHCCPENHFGETCAPCPLYNNKVCGGQGRCDGEGSRNGNGTCVCKRGFAGAFCSDCSKNFYRVSDEICERCHKACNGCSGEGAASCDACRKGWELKAGVCEDLNECSSPDICKTNEYCANREGSYICKACHKSCSSCVDAGPTNCTMCEPSHVLWNGMCVDDHLRSNLLQNALKRIGLYLGLLLITFFVFRKSKILASVVVIIVAVYIYYSESISKMNILDLFVNLYFVSTPV